MALAAGVVLGVAFIDLIPEAWSLSRGPFASSVVPAAMAMGFAAYMLLDRPLARSTQIDSSVRAQMGSAVLTLHSLLDGMGGFAFQVHPGIAWTVAIAVLTHDVADGINTSRYPWAPSVRRSPGDGSRSTRWLRWWGWWSGSRSICRRSCWLRCLPCSQECSCSSARASSSHAATPAIPGFARRSPVSRAWHRWSWSDWSRGSCPYPLGPAERTQAAPRWRLSSRPGCGWSLPVGCVARHSVSQAVRELAEPPSRRPDVADLTIQAPVTGTPGGDGLCGRGERCEGGGSQGPEHQAVNERSIRTYNQSALWLEAAARNSTSRTVETTTSGRLD